MTPVQATLAKLNPEQRRAATSSYPCVLVMAGAGSGKTSVTVARVGYLHEVERVGVSNMLMLTFTRLAAKEMKEKAARLVGERSAKNLWAGTFHAFCVSVLRQHAHLLGWGEDFSVYDQEDRDDVLKAVIADLSLESKTSINKIATAWVQPDPATPEYQVVAEYRNRLQRNNAIDLDGLLYLTVRLLTENADICMDLHKRFVYVFVDEYQDTDATQEHILQLLYPQNLFVVGDPSQAIYGWRGAEIENILTFEERHPGCEVVRLERNYRSTRQILAIANESIAKARHKSPLQLLTDKEGQQVLILCAPTDFEEATSIVKRVSSMGKPWRDTAVLCRTNAQVDLMHHMLQMANIPTYVVSNKFDPLNAHVARRLVDVMTLICNPVDQQALVRCINWPITRVSQQEMLRAQQVAIDTDRELVEVLAESGSDDAKEFLAAVIDYHETSSHPAWRSAKAMFGVVNQIADVRFIYESQGLSSKLAEIDAAEQAIYTWEARSSTVGDPSDPVAFLRWLRLRDIQERLVQDQTDGVRLLTIHAAKGLEWDNVFLFGCNDGVLPSRRGDPEEERRLFYVAVTRAKESLHISYADQRATFNGRMQGTKPSRFLAEAGLTIKLVG